MGAEHRFYGVSLFFKEKNVFKIKLKINNKNKKKKKLEKKQTKS
jgi:hypothetical protein